MAGGRAGGYGRRWGAVTLAQGGSIGQGKRERCFLTGAASAGHLRPSCIAGNFVSCPAPCSSPPGGLSSVPRWLQRATTGDGGSGCASSGTSGETTPGDWLSSCRCRLPDLSLQIPPPSLLPSGHPPPSPCPRIIPMDQMLLRITQCSVGAPRHLCQLCLPTRRCWPPPTHPQGQEPISHSIFTPCPPRTQTDPCSTGPRSTKLMLRGTSASHQ